MSGQICEPYAEYKDSRRTWLGAIPAHWSAFALKFLSSERVKDGPHETPAFVDSGIPFFSVDGIQDNELVLEGCRFISESDHERYSQKCRPATGDVLLGKAASVGKVAHVQLTEPFNVWSPLAVIRPQDERMGRYIYYAFQSAYLQAHCLVQSNSNTQNNLSMRAIDNLCFPAPPVEEQTQIAKFLDYETAKIDALIEKQQQLIALLKEKREAVISHAVTKGLNPDAPMRDSGVEWLGEVPAHWEEYPLGALFGLKHGYPFDSSRFDDSGDFILMTPGNFNERGGFRDKIPEKFYTGTDFPEEFVLKAGDLLVAMTEQGPGLLGSALFVPTEGTYLHNQRLGLVQGLCSEMVNARYLFHLFNSSRYRAEIGSHVTGSTVRHTSPKKIRSVKVWLPTVDEQQEIARFLDAHSDAAEREFWYFFGAGSGHFRRAQAF